MKQVDFSKIAQKEKAAPSSSDSQMAFMAKMAMSMMSKKMKIAIGAGIYLIFTGVIFNLYLLYLLISNLI